MTMPRGRIAPAEVYRKRPVKPPREEITVERRAARDQDVLDAIIDFGEAHGRDPWFEEMVEPAGLGRVTLREVLVRLDSKGAVEWRPKPRGKTPIVPLRLDADV